MNADKTTIAKAVHQLEEKGCLSRAQDQKDKRVRRLKLTASGKRLIAELSDIHEQWLNGLLEKLTPEERDAYEAITLKLLDIAKETTKEVPTE